MGRAGASGQSCCLIVRSFPSSSFRLRPTRAPKKQFVPMQQSAGVLSNSRRIFRSTGRFPRSCLGAFRLGCRSFRRFPLPHCRIPPPLEAEESLPHLSVMTMRRRVIKTKSRNLTGDTRFLIPLRREARRKGPTRCFAVKVSSLENPLPVARSLSRPAPGRGEEKEAEAGDQEGAKGHGG